MSELENDMNSDAVPDERQAGSPAEMPPVQSKDDFDQGEQEAPGAGNEPTLPAGHENDG